MLVFYIFEIILNFHFNIFQMELLVNNLGDPNVYFDLKFKKLVKKFADIVFGQIVWKSYRIVEN